MRVETDSYRVRIYFEPDADAKDLRQLEELLCKHGFTNVQIEGSLTREQLYMRGAGEQPLAEIDATGCRLRGASIRRRWPRACTPAWRLCWPASTSSTPTMSPTPRWPRRSSSSMSGRRTLRHRLTSTCYPRTRSGCRIRAQFSGLMGGCIDVASSPTAHPTPRKQADFLGHIDPGIKTPVPSAVAPPDSTKLISLARVDDHHPCAQRQTAKAHRWQSPVRVAATSVRAPAGQASTR